MTRVTVKLKTAITLWGASKSAVASSQ